MGVDFAESNYFGARPRHIQDKEQLPLRHMMRPIQPHNKVEEQHKLYHNKLGKNNTAIRV